MKHAVLLLTMLCLAPTAYANKIERFSLGNPDGFERAPELEIYSTDGERWTTVDATGTSRFQVQLRAECKWEGLSKKAYRGSMGVPGFVLVGETSPPNFDIPVAGSASGVFRWNGGQDQTLDPVQACNAELDKRVASDPKRTRHHFLAEGFRIDYPAALRVNYTLTCKPIGLGFSDIETKSVMVNARLQCGASPLAAAKIPADKPKPQRAASPPRRAQPLLQAASFEAVPEVHTGKCPAQIRFDGTLTASRAGEVTYQYVKNDGRKSPEFKLVFDGAGTKPTRAWQSTVAAPVAGTTLSAGSTAPGEVRGWYRLEVLAPAPKGQVTAHYLVACGADETGDVVPTRAAPARSAVPAERVR